MRARRAVWWLAGIAAGLLITALSGFLAHWSADWWPSTLSNAGITVLLAAPIAVYLARISSGVQQVSHDVENFQNKLDETQEVVRNLQDEARHAASKERERLTSLYEGLNTERPLTSRELYDVLEDAAEKSIISTYGLRVRIPETNLHVTFSTEDEDIIAISVETEDFDLLHFACIEPKEDGTYDSLAAALGVIQTTVQQKSGSAYDPSLPIDLLGKDLRKLLELRRKVEVGAIDEAIQILPDDWILTGRRLFHVKPPYSISLTRMNENWERHMNGKTWVNNDKFEEALHVARRLTERKGSHIV